MSWRDAVGRLMSARPAVEPLTPSPPEQRLALPAPQPPRPESPTEKDDMGEALVEQMLKAARDAGIQPDDPMKPLVDAMATAMRGVFMRAARSNRIADQASRHTLDAIQHARASADAETRRFKAELASTEADLISRVGSAIARTADDAFTRRVRVFDRNSILVATAVLVGTGAGCLGSGYWWSGSNARADIHETEAGLQAAFNGGVDDARSWFDLVSWNNIHDALQSCSASGRAFTDQGARRATCRSGSNHHSPLHPNP